MKKSLLTSLFLILANGTLASNYVWMGNIQGLEKANRIAVVKGTGENVEYVDACLVKALGEKLKKIQIGRCNVDGFSDEKERANKVKIGVDADFYVVPHLLECDTYKKWSPEKVDVVDMYWYKDNSGGPNGYHVMKRTEWQENFLIPGQMTFLNVVSLSYDVFNSLGEKVLTYMDEKMSYGEDYDKMINGLVKEFAGDVSKLPKNAKPLPDIEVCFSKDSADLLESGDFDKADALAYEVRRLAQKTDFFGGKKGSKDKWIVEVGLNRLETVWNWEEPHAATREVTISKREYIWRDKKNKERRGTISEKASEAYGIAGHYKFTGHADVDLKLSTGDGQVLMYGNFVDKDDKEVDAFRHAVEDFFKKVSKNMK